MITELAWWEVLIIGLSWDFGRWLYSQVKLDYKIRKGTAWRGKGYTIQGPKDWVTRTKGTILQVLSERAKVEVTE